MKGLLKHVHVSLVRFCADFADQRPDMTAEDFETFADEGTFPQNDVVGISGVEIGVDEEMCDIQLLIGISTRDDTNLFRLRDYVSDLFDLLLPTEKIALYHHETGKQIGWMVVENGTRTMPVGGASRPLQFIMVNLTSILTFG